MTKAEAIKTIFKKKNSKELSEIWEQVFLPQISALTGKPQIHPIILDDLYVKEYGNYDGSFGDDIKERFGEDVLKALLD